MSYIGYTPFTYAERDVKHHVVTATQTVLTADYAPGYLDVIVNGEWLQPDDYTATNGTTITLTTPIASSSDEVTTISWGVFESVNHSPTEDFFSGDDVEVNFTLSKSPPTDVSIFVVVGGVPQDTGTYSLSGTTLTFSEPPPTGTNNISVRHLGVVGESTVPADNSVTEAKLDTSIKNDRIASAWVSFNGTGTVAIKASYNVSSITDNGTGLYSINFNNALSTSTYSVSGMTSRASSYSNTVNQIGMEVDTNKTTSLVKIGTSVHSGSTTSAHDPDDVDVQIFGGK